jgi:tripartite-type tricarboxylate transporter receptor subunit TctC
MTASLSRRGLMMGGAALIGSGTATGAFAQGAWPDRPVRLVVGFTAGSATDVTGRLFAQRFSEAWGQPVVVENVAGNSGAIGVDRVAKAAPDGYTLMWAASAALTLLPNLQRLPFDPVKDLAPIHLAFAMPSLFVSNRDFPPRTIQELVAYAKANPGKVSYGTPGVGTPQHAAGEMFCSQAGIKMEHIPYRGANMADVLNGSVQLGIQNIGAVLPMVRDGQLRGLGITTLQRSANAPEIPTLVEQGFPGFEASSWFGTMAPAGTPQPILTRVQATSRAILADPAMRQRFTGLGLDIVDGDSEQMRARIADDIAKWARVIRESGIKLQS